MHIGTTTVDFHPVHQHEYDTGTDIIRNILFVDYLVRLVSGIVLVCSISSMHAEITRTRL